MSRETLIPHSPDPDLSGYREVPPEDRVTYNSFLQGEDVEPGKMIVDIKPRDLFTYQDWVDEHKIMNVLSYSRNNNPLLTQITGYLYFHPKFEREVIVIGNGNHRTIYAIIHGTKINVEIKDPPEEKKETNPFRITNTLKKYGDMFTGY